MSQVKRERSRVLIRANDLVQLHNTYLRREQVDEAAFELEKLQQLVDIALDQRKLCLSDQEDIYDRLERQRYAEIESGRGNS